jgi:hypothetical protein
MKKKMSRILPNLEERKQKFFYSSKKNMKTMCFEKAQKGEGSTNTMDSELWRVTIC